MQLPALLQPWADWLALFPDDQADLLGKLLLRLDPLVGPLRRHAAAAALEPAGIGDIVARGPYERLLISQWAYADSAPDEFVRRAAQGELLFTGPEPAHSDMPLRSIALFDAGPLQLGEPRLAHVALFVLLARRAALAGAAFEWGVLQQPGVMHANVDADGIRKLLKARIYAVPGAACVAAWDACLDPAAADCWLVGDPQSACPAAVRAHVHVRRSWLADALDVVVTQRRRSAAVTLPLPAPDAAIRLLRHPFAAASRAGVPQPAAGAHSIKRAPLFGARADALAVGMVDGGVTVYHVPDSPHAKPGRPRTIAKPAHAESIVAAGLCQKVFGTIALRDNALHFAGFPGPLFTGPANAPADLPGAGIFKAVAGTREWLPAFHFLQRADGAVAEQVYVLDKAGHLVCWSRSGPSQGPAQRTACRLVAEHVVGIAQHADKLLFAVSHADRTDAYSVRNGETPPAHLYPLMHHGSRFLFADVKNWRGGRGTYALQLDPTRWLVGENAGADEITVEGDGIVLGCARMDSKTKPGLVVLDAGRMHIALHSGTGRTPLVQSTEKIVQASFDPLRDRLAWLGRRSGMLTVRGIGMTQPFLQTVPRGGVDDD